MRLDQFSYLQKILLFCATLRICTSNLWWMVGAPKPDYLGASLNPVLRVTINYAFFSSFDDSAKQHISQQHHNINCVYLLVMHRLG